MPERIRMQRRLRRQRRVREAMLLDLGALVYELHRQGKRAPELLQHKAAQLSVVDDEVRGLEDALAGEAVPPTHADPPEGATDEWDADGHPAPDGDTGEGDAVADYTGEDDALAHDTGEDDALAHDTGEDDALAHDTGERDALAHEDRPVDDPDHAEPAFADGEEPRP